MMLVTLYLATGLIGKLILIRILNSQGIKLLKANKCLCVIRTLRSEGAHQEEVNKLFTILSSKYDFT